MKNLLKMATSVFLMIMLAFGLVACGSNDCKVKETVTLAKTILGEVEFENGDKVTLKQDCDKVVIGGNIDAMSAAELSEFGAEDVSHVVVLKFMFDKEKTIDSFEIEGGVTKVYSTDETKEKSDYKITIPMKGKAESLNAAVAASISVWEMMK